MKTKEKQILQIQTSFAQMQSREDLLNLLNSAKPMIYGEKAVPFELKQLSYYTNPKRSKKSYKEFIIKKKSGADRTILAPEKGLKALQKTLSFILQCVYEPHKAAMGFTKGKSIVNNAQQHARSNYVYNIDLKDFFPSIDQARVWKCLQLKPFNLVDMESSEQENSLKIKSGVRKVITDFNEHIYYKVNNQNVEFIKDKKGNYFKYRDRIILNYYLSVNENDLDEMDVPSDNNSLNQIVFEDFKKYFLADKNLEELKRLFSFRSNLANIIAAICCTEMETERLDPVSGNWVKTLRNVLPQGAPTSPVLSNVVCQRLDYLLTAVANRFGARYTRYADDITFSSMHNIYQKDSDFLKELHRIIADQNFHIKESKTRLQKEGYKQEVTGLIVNTKPNVSKRYVKQLRLWLYYWERYGYSRANEFFLQQYVADKGHVKKGKPNMVNVIGGKLEYLKMVKGVENELYLKLNKRFLMLQTEFSPISNILNIWEKEGIDKAINKYYDGRK